ncbi:MAG: DUF2156 domain-containing protein [Bacteroidetes bacterium]|nr:DUF2156 domain-containing protein [Bacteroidota bacterium]
MQENFLNLKFIPIELSHKNQVEPLLLREPPLLSGYTLASLLSWKIIFQYEWAMFQEKMLLISGRIPQENVRYMLQPIGIFTKENQEILLSEIKKLDYPITIYGVDERFIERHPEFTSHFEIINDLGFANYIYKAEDLALLQGRNYAKKRNLISQAENAYQWSANPIKNDCLSKCIELLEQICHDDHIEEDEGLMNERLALDFTLRNFSELKQKGLVIRVDDKPVAFSIFEELNPDTAVIHFEKADRSYKGLYQLINHETSRILLESGYKFINREEDINLPGLRKAKQSYYPIELRPAYQLIFK